MTHTRTCADARTHAHILAIFSPETRSSTIASLPLPAALLSEFFYNDPAKSAITSCYCMTAVLCWVPMTLRWPQAWKSHVQCQCSELSTTAIATTFSVLTLCNRVLPVLHGHYLIFLSRQCKESTYSRHPFAYEETEAQKCQAVWSSGQTQLVWFGNGPSNRFTTASFKSFVMV